MFHPQQNIHRLNVCILHSLHYIYIPSIHHKVLISLKFFLLPEYLVYQGATMYIPRLWFYMIGNCITQFICIRSVFVLTTEFSSLSVTMVVTLRKFVSLMISIFFFQNPFTVYHWVATALVFTGTFIFLDLHNRLLQIWTPEKEKKEQ
jgi:UDP-xylose/UDP-N-acetylglucosamine transporter B4